MTREETLDTAKKMVCGHREQDYGTPENNFQIIADLWNVYLQKCVHRIPLFASKKEEIKVHITPFDVAIMMSLFKHGRIISGSATDDSLVDACGYLACGAEIKAQSYSENIEKILKIEKEGLKEMVKLNQEVIAACKEFNAPKTTEKEEPKTEESNKLKDLILKTYGDADGYISCCSCPLEKMKENYCDILPCNGRGQAVDTIYNYLKDKAHEDPAMAIIETLLKENKETNTVNWDDRDPGSGAKLY